MNPLRLVAANYRSFQELDLELPDGCVAILGQNGAGKSSVVDAIDLAVFGPESRSLAEALSEGVTDDELLLELELEHAGSVYRIRRTYSPRGRGKTTLDFEKGWASESSYGHGFNETTARASGWEPLTCESAGATQERICATLGLSRATFRASSFLRQGDGSAFSEAAPRERKRILSEVLGLDRWGRLLELVRADRKILDARVLQLDGQATTARETVAGKAELDAQLADITAAALDLADKVADLEREHADLTARYQEAREHQARRAAAVAEHATAEAALARVDEQAARAAEAVQSISVARDELASLTSAGQLDDLLAREQMLQALAQLHRDTVAERDRLVTAAREASLRRADILGRASECNEKAHSLRADADRVLEDAGHAECDRCGQTLGLEAARRAAASYRAEADSLDAEAKRLDEQAAVVVVPEVPEEPEPPSVDGVLVSHHLTLIGEAITRARAEQAQRARLEERIRACERTLDEQPSDETVAAVRADALQKAAALAAIGMGPDVAVLEQHGRRVGAELASARGHLAQTQTARARLEERLAQIAAAEELLERLARERATVEHEQTVVVALERAFSPDGIPALIVENSAIPYLEGEATRILAELGTSFRVELRTQAALKSGDGLRDTLDVLVCSEAGERPYETFSGGERTRIDLALRIALARLLAHRRGAESRLLCIDEPEFLDEEGTRALVEVLRGLEGDFDKLYVVSHVPALRDSFDVTLGVSKVDGVSRVVGSDVFAVEAVA